MAVLLLLLALFAAAMLGAATAIATASRTRTYEWFDLVPWPFLFAFATAGLIVFYDATAKYLGGLGILTLGVIRSLHCLIGNPRTPLLFPSMFLLTHVAVVTFIAYRLENKRPRLKAHDYIILFGGLTIGNTAAAFWMHFHHAVDQNPWPLLTGPIAAMIVSHVGGLASASSEAVAAAEGRAADAHGVVLAVCV